MELPRMKKPNLESETEREAIKQQIHEKLLYLAEGMEDSGWEFVIEERGVTVSRTLSVVENVRGTKGVSLLSGTPEQILELITDITNWKKWDPHVAEAKLIEEYGDIKINYLQYRQMFPVSSRDVCFLSSVVKHPEDGGYSVVWLSASSSLYAKKSGIVRARFHPSGFVIQPLQGSASCLVTYVLQFDLKGWVPTAVQNGITAQLPLVLCGIEQTLKGQDVVSVPIIDISTLDVEETPGNNTGTVSPNSLSTSTGSDGNSPSTSRSDDETNKFMMFIKRTPSPKQELNDFLAQKSPRKLVSKIGKRESQSSQNSPETLERELPKKDRSPKKKNPLYDTQ